MMEEFTTPIQELLDLQGGLSDLPKAVAVYVLELSLWSSLDKTYWIHIWFPSSGEVEVEQQEERERGPCIIPCQTH